MKNEIKEFEAKYMKSVKEVLVLTETGSSASKIGQKKMWQANVTVLAMIDVATNEFIEEKRKLTWLMSEEECRTEEKIFSVKGEKIYRLKVRENYAYTTEFFGQKNEVKQGNSLWVQEVLERDCFEERLQAVLEAYQKEVVLQAVNCEKLLLDKSLNLFCGEGSFNGCDCSVNFDADGEREQTANDAMKTWAELSKDSAKWDKEARAYAAKKLVDNANDWLADSVEEGQEFEEITQADFAKRMQLSEVCVSTDGNFEIYYDDDDMFWGHVIIVSGNIDDGFDDAYIAG